MKARSDAIAWSYWPASHRWKPFAVGVFAGIAFGHRRSAVVEVPAAAAVRLGLAGCRLWVGGERRCSLTGVAPTGSRRGLAQPLLERRQCVAPGRCGACRDRIRRVCSRWPFSSDWRSMSAICRSSASSRWSSVDDRGLRGRRFGREAGGVGRPAAREDLPLDLLNLPLEPVEALLRRRRRLALRQTAAAGSKRRWRRSRKDGDRTRRLHGMCSPGSGSRLDLPRRAFRRRLNPTAPGGAAEPARRARLAGAAHQVGGLEADVGCHLPGRADGRRHARFRP